MPDSALHCPCPHCGSRILLRNRGLIGTKVSCPKCKERFLVEDPDDLDIEEPEEVREPARRRQPARDAAEDDRPRRRKKSKQKSGLLLGVVLLGGGVVLVGGGILILVLTRKPAPKVKLPPGWKEIVSTEGRFRAAMPSSWVKRTRTMPSPAGPVTDTQYLHEVNGEDLSYAISYADSSPAQLRKASLDQVISAGRDAILKSYGGNLAGERHIELDGRRGREFVVRVPGRGNLLFRYYIAGARLYVLSMAGSGADFDSKEGRAFFGSFRFTDR